jgi:proteasome lid subunit RPN8/RPN11
MKKQIQTQLEKVQLTPSLKVKMPENVYNKIKYACTKIPSVEWSGVLFYTVEGSIKEPEKMVLVLQDILPMQKGVSSYTEYTFDERVIEFITKEGREDWKMGHIHSHNNMGVFFSGTDCSELHDNAPQHNFYLSLIVNNKMEFTAKVGYIATSKNSGFEAKDENGEIYEVLNSGDEKKLMVHNCTIDVEKPLLVIDKEFTDGIEYIIEKAKPKTYSYPGSTGYIPSWKQTYNKKGKKSKKGKSKTYAPPSIIPTFYQNKTITPIESDINNMTKFNTIIEEFAMYVINNGNYSDEFNDVADIIMTMYIPYDLTPYALASTIISKYNLMYNKYFDKVLSKESPTTFIKITDALIDEIELCGKMEMNPVIEEYLKVLAESLKNMLTKILKDGLN